MNFAVSLRRLTTPKQKLEEQDASLQAESILDAQREAELISQHAEWLKHPFSIALMNELIQAQKFFNDKAELLALDRNDSNIPLIQSSTLKKVISYATRREAIVPSNASTRTVNHSDGDFTIKSN